MKSKVITIVENEYQDWMTDFSVYGSDEKENEEFDIVDYEGRDKLVAQLESNGYKNITNNVLSYEQVWVKEIELPVAANS